MLLHEDLQRVFDAYVTAYRAGDAAGCAACFLPLAEMYSPYAPPALGRASIEAVHRDWVGDDGGADKTMTIAKVGGIGDLAWCLARYSEAAGAYGGTSLSVLERQGDGTWLIRMCSLNADE